MVYIIAYRLKRKNARRKVEAKLHSASEESAIKNFKIYVDKKNDPNRQWELLTGDWKHITFYEGKE